jgi:hypothetical protein
MQQRVNPINFVLQQGKSDSFCKLNATAGKSDSFCNATAAKSDSFCIATASREILRVVDY